MGQGLYAGFVWGANEWSVYWEAIDTNLDDADDESSLILKFNEHLSEMRWVDYDRGKDVDGSDHCRRYAQDRTESIAFAYESSPCWCGFWVACNDPALSESRRLTKEIDRTSFDARSVRRVLRGPIRKARERWEKFRAYCRERGVEVGPGKLMFVSDWD
jgi:hypothetical protein